MQEHILTKRNILSALAWVSHGGEAEREQVDRIKRYK